MRRHSQQAVQDELVLVLAIKHTILTLLELRFLLLLELLALGLITRISKAAKLEAGS